MIKCSTKSEGERDVYWQSDKMNDVITAYKASDSTEARSNIYNIHIHKVLSKMNEIWARKILGKNASEDVITDGLSFAAKTLDKFNSKYGDAFGFLSVSLKRHYQQVGINYQKYTSRHSSLEELNQTSDGDTIEIDLKPMYEPSFRDDSKVNLVIEFLSDERNYTSICRKYGYRAGSRPIRRLKQLYQLLQLNEDTCFNKDYFVKLLHEISPVFLDWLEKRPDGPVVPVVISDRTKLTNCKCVQCGKIVITPPREEKGNCNFICEECRYKKRTAYKPPIHAYNCTTCHTPVYRIDKPRNGVIYCPACKEQAKIDKANESRKETTITCRQENKLDDNEGETKEKDSSMISLESIVQENKSSHRIIEFFLKSDLHTLSIHSSSITFSEQTEQSIKFFRGISDFSVANRTYLSHKCSVSEEFARDDTVACPNDRKLKMKTTLSIAVESEEYVPKSKQKVQVTCPKCGESREVGYSLYIKTKSKPIMCRKCWANDKEYIAKKTAKALNTKKTNKTKQGFVPRKDQQYELTCPKCGKVRGVQYSYYLEKHDNPPLCHNCCNGDPELLQKKISSRMKTIKEKHLTT